MLGDLTIYKRVWNYLRPYRKTTLLGAGLAALAAGAQLLKPWPFKWLVDHALEDGRAAGEIPWALLLIPCVALLVIHAVWSVLHYSSQMLFLRVGLAGVFRLRTQLFEWLQSLPLRWHQGRNTSDSSFRVAYDAQGLQKIYHNGWVSLFTSVLTLVAALGIMFFMNWKLTLIAVAVFPGVFVIMRSYASRIRRESEVSYQHESDLLGSTQQGMELVSLVQAYGREQEEVGRFRNRALRSLSAALRVRRSELRGTLWAGLVVAAGTAVLYFAGAHQVLQEELTLGSLIVFVAYLAMLYQPVESLSYTAWAMESGAASVKRCFDVLDRENDVRDAPDALPLESLQGDLFFENVTFSYDDTRAVLKELALHLEPGASVFLVGPSGCGKSTLLGMIPRFFDPDHGRITMDGHDLRAVTKESLRRQISLMLQEPFLADASIHDNIAYSVPEATRASVEQAAARAGLHEFIQSLPDGYDSPVGERGVRISVGQRQRISIARCFLRDTPVLLMDEPTSALDEETEETVMRTVRSLCEGRTSILVTHRLHLIRDQDEVLFMGEGRILERGPFIELRQGQGRLARWCQSQNQKPWQ